MDDIIKPDDYSLASYYVEACFDNTILSNASCFFYVYNQQIFLVTNWHVVSGRDSNTLECLSKTGGIPNNLKVYVFEKTNSEVFYPGKVWKVPLFKNDTPLWIENTNNDNNSKVDVVVIPVTVPQEVKVFPINTLEEPFNESTSVCVKDEVFVIGFPFGIKCCDLPIWKRASIASEPLVNINDKPILYVDTTTKPGMSGSPVVYKERRSVALGGKNGFSRFFTKFIGVYSGRVYTENIYEAQLGIVWKASVIDELIKSKFS